MHKQIDNTLDVKRLLMEFYNTLELSVDLSEMSGKTCQGIRIDGDFVVAYYSEAKLAEVTSCLIRNKTIGDNYTYKALKSLVSKRIITVFVKEPNEIQIRIDELLKELLTAIPDVMNVYMCIQGMSDVRRVKLGEFEFIPNADYEKIGIKYFNEQIALHIKEDLWRNHDHVMVSVSACESVKAQEKAYAEFQWLENAARLFVDSDFYDIGITSFNCSTVENSLVTSADGVMRGVSSRLKGSPVSLPFTKVFDPGNNLCRIVEKLGRSQNDLTPLQRRIRHAVYLGGLSVHETVPEMAYFLGVSAFEALFQKETDKYVNPSIAQQIIESFCYLVADESHRRNVFETMRPFYGKRSAFAHGGRTIVSTGDLDLLRAYLRAAILKLIDDPVLSGLKTIDEVAALICDKKFGAKNNATDKNGGR